MIKSPYATIDHTSDDLLDHFATNRQTLLDNWRKEVDEAVLKGQEPPLMPLMPMFPTERMIIEKDMFLSEYMNDTSKPVLK